MGEKVRKTGIEIVGDASWGTHFCQFYQTKDDLIDILVPYFKTGLENNEFCMWITSEPLNAEDARRALRKEVKNLGDHIKKGQIEILDYSRWYTRSGRFDSNEVLQGWVEKEKQALEKGFEGLRLTGNTLWLEKKDWKDFADYEAAVNSVIGKYRMLAVCTYCLNRCTALEIIDVMSNHQFALIKREGKWEIIESAEHRKTIEALWESENRYRTLLKNIPQKIFYKDLHSTYMLCNKSYADDLKIRAAEVRGKTDYDFFPKELAEKYRSDDKRIMESDKAEEIEEKYLKDGEKVIVHTFKAPVKDEKGNTIGIFGIFWDVTERKETEEALQKSEQELTIRNRIADIFLTIPDDEIYGEILQVLLEAMESRYGIFGYIDEDQSLIIPSMTRDVWQKCRVADKTIIYPRDKWGGIWGRALIEKRSLYANEGLRVPEGHIPISRVLVVPIMYGGEAIGLLEVANKDTDYGEKDRQLLEGIAGRIAPILNARLQRDRQQTQRRSMEEALHKSEKRYRELYDGSQDGYVLTDMKANIIEFNSAYKNMLGYPEKELLQKKYVDLTPPKWYSVEAEIIKEQILKKGYSEIYEKEYIRKDGTVFPIELRVHLAKDKKGKPIGMWAFIRDISERKEAEARQLLTEKILRCLNQDKPSLDLIVDILTLIKEATGFEAVGLRLREKDDFPYFAVSGFSAEFVQAENYLCARDETGQVIRYPDGEPLLECMCGSVLSGRTNPSLPFFTEVGSFWTNSTTMLLASTSGQERLGRTRNRCNQAGYESVALIPLRSGDRIVGLLQLNDKWPGRLTPEMIRFFEGIGASIGIALARIRAEEELQRSEERYALAQRAASIGSWDWDVPTGNLVWSEQIEPIFGFARGGFGGTYEAFLDCVHPEDRQYVIDSVNACLEESKYYAIEHRIVWPDKTVHWVSETGDVVRDESGKAARMLGIAQDITERKLVEQQIKNLAKFPSEDPYPVLRIAKDGMVLYANSAGSELLEEWRCQVGGHVPEHWHQYVSQVLETGSNRELETICGDRIFSLITAPVVDAGYVNVYGIDITERKQAEEDLREYRQHLEELVRARTIELTEANKKMLEEIEQRKCLEKEILNISEREQRRIGQELHDSLGQQLTGVAFMTKVLEQKLAKKSLNEATDVAEIAKLVNQATDQARGLSKGLHPVDLDAGTLTSALRELAASTESLFSNRCTFKYDKRVKVDDPEVAVHLYRITQEAITNAIRHGRAKHIQIDLDYGKGKSVLTVKNDGLDFPKEFEARGTGMGLQIMDHRVDIIGGSLDVRKAAEGGTILTCTFPNKKH